MQRVSHVGALLVHRRLLVAEAERGSDDPVAGAGVLAYLIPLKPAGLERFRFLGGGEQRERNAELLRDTGAQHHLRAAGGVERHREGQPGVILVFLVLVFGIVVFILLGLPARADLSRLLVVLEVMPARDHPADMVEELRRERRFLLVGLLGDETPHSPAASLGVFCGGPRGADDPGDLVRRDQLPAGSLQRTDVLRQASHARLRHPVALGEVGVLEREHGALRTRLLEPFRLRQRLGVFALGGIEARAVVVYHRVVAVEMLEPLTQDALRGLEVPLLDLHLEEQRKRPHVLVVVLEEDVFDLPAAVVQPSGLVAKLSQETARLHVQGIGLDRLLQPVDYHAGLVALGIDPVDGHAPAREPGEVLRAHEAVGGRLDKRHERGHVLLARDLRDIGPEPHGRHVLGLQLENLPAKAVGLLQLPHPQLQRGLLEFYGGAVRDDFRDVAWA